MTTEAVTPAHPSLTLEWGAFIKNKTKKTKACHVFDYCLGSKLALLRPAVTPVGPRFSTALGMAEVARTVFAARVMPGFHRHAGDCARARRRHGAQKQWPERGPQRRRDGQAVVDNNAGWADANPSRGTSAGRTPEPRPSRGRRRGIAEISV